MQNLHCVRHILLIQCSAPDDYSIYDDVILNLERKRRKYDNVMISLLRFWASSKNIEVYRNTKLLRSSSILCICLPKSEITPLINLNQLDAHPHSPQHPPL